ncbi:unnamed protein product [Protopolystoma xenopodis]|uniref:L-asparaginase N-terminal domain-containing protein n=1 Tax=Protopolystoma xenopodis TaxID=117903 RepID=A0A3S5BIU4_9PLAT|nr:unnamed protein product [Protopolystoma xenopodis]
MTMDDWLRIARDVEADYHKYDGFIVLHGTDTMSYTASALSYILENLGKSVIITGSQIPIFEIRSDGRDNFLGALLLAGGDYSIPEVTVYFHNKFIKYFYLNTDIMEPRNLTSGHFINTRLGISMSSDTLRLLSFDIELYLKGSSHTG